MADSQIHSVKSLNFDWGRKRFTFKSYTKRIEEIKIDVFHSLHPIKPEPSEGSTFFRDELLHWRELNTAEDFISFYDEVMPLVQTLPQILLHKEKIFTELIGRLHMGARLSLEPVLMLLSALSRDILEDYIPFLWRLSESLVDLLKNGGDCDPEIVEQVFKFWSYIMIYLQKYLVNDIIHVLKITFNLRYFGKDYIQDFMAKPLSFLFRNSPMCELRKGIRRLVRESEKFSSPIVGGANAALLCHVMRGTSSTLHSRAGTVLKLLFNKSILGTSVDSQNEVLSNVISEVLNRLCGEADHGGINLILGCLTEEILSCLDDTCLLHLKRLLFLLKATISQMNESNVLDDKPLFGLLRLLIDTYAVPFDALQSGDQRSDVVDSIFELMLCLLDVPIFFRNLPSIFLTYAPVFNLKNLRLLSFIKGLILKDPHVSFTFRSHIICSLGDFIETSTAEVLFLLLEFFEKQRERQYCDILNGVEKDMLLKMCRFFEKTFNSAKDWLSDGYTVPDDTPISSILAVLWGAIRCYPYFCCVAVDSSSLKNLLGVLHQFLEADTESIKGLPKDIWRSVFGAALSCHQKFIVDQKSRFSETSNFLCFAGRHRRCPHVLSAVAEFLDSTFGLKSEFAIQPKYLEFDAEATIDSVNRFSDNLCIPNKATRVATLRILSHHAPVQEIPSNDERPLKKVKREAGDCTDSSQPCNVVELLFSIESTPISISSSRKVVNLLSKLQIALTSERIYVGYIPLLLCGLMGMLHNRFKHFWDPAVQCISILLCKHNDIIWNKFIDYFGEYQSLFLSSGDQLVKSNAGKSKSSSLDDLFRVFSSPDFDSTPHITILSLLLQSLQKASDVAESRSRDLVPLFFKFLCYADHDELSSESSRFNGVKGKEWRILLKEWLNLLRLMHNARSLYRSQLLKDVFINRLLDEIDSEVQLKVLECLFNWRDDFLTPYEQHLKHLVTSKNPREELTTWSVSRESQLIQGCHRNSLVPLVIRLLTPKVRKLKVLKSSKHTGVNQRRAVLSFLAQLDVGELYLFFFLLLKPLLPVSAKYELDGLSGGQSETLDLSGTSFLWKCSASIVITGTPLKKRFGFLHVVEDMLRTFDEFHIGPFLRPSMMIIARMLENCTSIICSQLSRTFPDNSRLTQCEEIHTIKSDADMLVNISVKEFKDMRSLCLKITASVLNKYGHHDFGAAFWDTFLLSVRPLIESFKQEGSSSERPSSLFSCFLAMSQSPFLVSLFERESNLVPNVFSILTVRTASDAITASVLCFIENLLNLDKELDHLDDNPPKNVLLPHIETLISCLHEFFQIRKETHRKSAQWPRNTELRILRLLARYINNSSNAEQFADVLLHSFRRKAIDHDECLEGLRVLKDILPALKDKTNWKVLNGIHPLLIYGRLDVRLCICDIVEGLTSFDPSLAVLAKLLRNLNAMSPTELGEIDYDKRLGAYEMIGPELFFSFNEEHVLVLLSQCVYDMQSQELIFRQSASRALKSFIEFSVPVLKLDAGDSEILSQDEFLCDRKDTVEGASQFYGSLSKSCIQQIIKKILLLNMGKAMIKSDISVQKEWITLMRDMVYRIEGISSLHVFKPLCSDDPEVDFFNNIVHLQIHRRARALTRFKGVIDAGFFSEDVILEIFVPLFFGMLFDVKDGKGEHLRNACLETLKSISGQMRWSSYCKFLSRCFKEITRKPEKQKILIRLICAIIDSFHFYKEQPAIGENLSVTSHISSEPDIPVNVMDYLQKTVFPQIQSLLKSDTEKVNVNISLLVVKVLKLLPTDVMESHLPSVVHRISNFLKNRLESIRDEARSALSACAKELGPEYLQFIVKVLRATLKRGYELHVLGYTLNFMLSSVFMHGCVGKIDYCLDELLSIVQNDILGDVAEEKEVDKIASRMKETNKNRSFESLELIARIICFRTHALKLLSPIFVQLHKHVSPKIKVKVEKMLHHVGLGIESNSSAGSEEFLTFLYGLIEDILTEENLQNRQTSKASTNGVSSQEAITKTNPSYLAGFEPQNYHFVTVFALDLLHKRLKNMKPEKKDEKSLSMLDPFVKLLGACLNSKYEDVLVSLFRCLTRLVRLQLPSLQSQAETIKICLVDIVQRYGNASNPLVQSCLRLLTVLLQSTSVSLSNEHLRMLVQLPMFVDLQANPDPLALSVLKSILGRKIVVPEIYDIVMQVAELMVASQLEPVRKKCRQILLQFLMDYRLSDKRLQQHINFLLTNLRYEHSSGREAVLEMLHDIVLKFPSNVIDGQADTFFISLCVALSNEGDNDVRSMISMVIKELLSRSSQTIVQSILRYSLTWYMGEKNELLSVAAEVLGLLVEVHEKGISKHVDQVLQVAKRILEFSIPTTNTEGIQLSNETSQLWTRAYYSLVMLKKILLRFPKLCLDSKLEEIWEITCKILLHPHSLLRSTASQLITFYFSAASEAVKFGPKNPNFGNIALLKPSRLFFIAVSLIHQIKMHPPDATSATSMIQNLVHSVIGLHYFERQRQSVLLYEYWSTLDPCEQGYFINGFEILGSRKARKMFLLSTSNSSIIGSTDKDVYEDYSFFVVPILKKLSKMSMQEGESQMKNIFESFKILSSRIDLKECQGYAIHILQPLYKVCCGFSGKEITDEAKELAEEVQKGIRDNMGGDNFIRVYNQIRGGLKERREKRKRGHKLMAVTDPMRHAKRKLRIADKHRAHKKRKIEIKKQERRRK